MLRWGGIVVTASLPPITVHATDSGGSETMEPLLACAATAVLITISSLIITITLLIDMGTMEGREFQRWSKILKTHTGVCNFEKVSSTIVPVLLAPRWYDDTRLWGEGGREGYTRATHVFR